MNQEQKYGVFRGTNKRGSVYWVARPPSGGERIFYEGTYGGQSVAKAAAEKWLADQNPQAKNWDELDKRTKQLLARIDELEKNKRLTPEVAELVREEVIDVLYQDETKLKFTHRMTPNGIEKIE